MKLLHLDASILGAHSVSRTVSAAIAERFAHEIPDLHVVYRDLAADPLPHLSGAQLAGRAPGAENAPELQAELAASDAALDEFLSADIVVIGAPMYNFTLPTQLKAWIDRVLVAGKTFRYGASGAEGLAGGKRVVVALARGGFYGAETPQASAEHLETYLRAVFGFIGVTDLTFIAADGIAVGPEQREQALSGAVRRAEELKAA
ncbi:FMN-dependent NADH-azoreductase [Hansschlegelia quercus]|uniref:FMN dependent NADH:quinone oxidoreductase n=1 Tax=Hansschlegelia quercus TaxID=2528245 RepID=A0A4V2JEG5_9HYPH|nr:NAD(P)H-dependent oxidoreductase [Hansschlegelia quercus]TBN55176.1 FMN-dependent NADH-azoreductase [Hansschlegelia quercus]